LRCAVNNLWPLSVATLTAEFARLAAASLAAMCVEVCCSAVQRVAVYCSVLQCVAVCPRAGGNVEVSPVFNKNGPPLLPPPPSTFLSTPPVHSCSLTPRLSVLILKCESPTPSLHAASLPTAANLAARSERPTSAVGVLEKKRKKKTRLSHM